MPRSVRIEYEGAVYHVMCRGDRREAIFQDDDDRRLMVETLAETCERAGFVIHSYVLMPNHYHFLVETPEANLVAGMKWFQGTYTQRHNRRHRLAGHLFQGRYKAIPVQTGDGEYFSKVSQYIHLNPVRAGLLNGGNANLRDFPWSSYPSFLADQKLPAWLHRARVFGGHDLADEDQGSRRRYEALMTRRAVEIQGRKSSEEEEGEWMALRRGWYLGNEAFRDWLMERAGVKLAGRRRDSYRDEGLRRHDEGAATQLMNKAAAGLGVSLDELRCRKQSDPVKQAVAWWVKSRSVVGDEWICNKLGMGCRTNISRAVSAFRVGQDKLRAQLKRKLHVCAD